MNEFITSFKKLTNPKTYESKLKYQHFPRNQIPLAFINGTSTSIDMDKLNYTYEANGNQLLGVSDNATVSYNLGDFDDAHQGTDYAYDNNGNLTQDLNKGITNVTYTHFNKPQTISFANGNKIAYSYDASGSKIQEWVSADSKIKRTDYIGNFIYENDTLHQAMTPQGRTVWENGSPSEEFFVKDHLGNIRTIIETKIKPIKNYLGKYELASANIEDLFFEHHDEIRDDKPGSTDPSDMKAGRLNGAEQEHRIGTALLLKVMAGDKIELHVDNYYENYEPGSDDPVSTEDLLADLISTLSGGIGGLGESESHNPEMIDRFLDPDKFLSVEDLLRGNEDPQRPKAYLNYILYDENMEIVRTFTGSFQANGNGGWQTIGTQAPLELPSNGYLAVYLSNQSKPSGCGVCGDVYFDDFELEISTGKLKEETHYYPFGLPMANAGAAASGLEPNRHKYQGNEYVKDAGLNWMDFNFRQYDPQIGRFLGIDPLAASGGQDMFSPYAAMGNNPGMMTDPEGLLAKFTTASNGGVNYDDGPLASSMAFWTPGQTEKNFNHFWDLGRGGGGSGISSVAFWNNVNGVVNSMSENTNAFLHNNRNGSFSVTFFEGGGGGGGGGTLGSAIDLILSTNATLKSVDDYGMQRWQGSAGGFLHNPFGALKGYGRDIAYVQKEKGDGEFDIFKSLFNNGTFIPGAALALLDTKVGAAMSMGGAYVFKSSTYTAQKALARELAYGTKFVKAGSNLLGGIGLGITYIEFKNGQISGLEAGIDATFGIIGIWGGPIGAGVSIMYFGGKALYESYTGETLFNKPGDQ